MDSPFKEEGYRLYNITLLSDATTNRSGALMRNVAKMGFLPFLLTLELNKA